MPGLPAVAAPERRRWTDALALLWLVATALAVLLPALAHGASLGPFDLLSRYGLSRAPGVVVHYTGPGDQIEQMIPWTTLAWTQVHHGHLPLWDPYSGLGTPLLFNWQSSALAVPTLVGYLFPVRLAYTVAQVVTLVIAGTGVFVLGRVLRLGVLGAVAAATVYQLSGPMVGWLGWPNAGTAAWAGWLLAATVLVLRGRRRAASVALFAVVLACALYGGQPEGVVLEGIAVAVFVAVELAWSARRTGSTPVLRPLTDLVLAALAGGALSAPLLLPGLQVASASIVRSVSHYGALPPHDAVHLLFQGFDGLPVAGSRWFGNSIYPETAAYVGVVAAVLGVVALATRWRRPEVPALTAVAVVGAALAYAQPVVSALNDVTGLSSVAWHRSVFELALVLGVLAGVGADALARPHAEVPTTQDADAPTPKRVGASSAERWTAWGFVGAAVVVAGVWVVGRGTLPPHEASLRDRSFLWPVGLVVLGLAVSAALALARRRRVPQRARPQRVRAGTWAVAALLAGETAFLVAAGAPLVSSSPTFLTPTPAEASLARAVGTGLVGFVERDCHVPPGLGIHQDVNVVFAVHELASYDPMTPVATFRSLARATGRPASAIGAPLVLCPAITDATVARQFGVGFVLGPAGAPRPPGAQFVRSIAGEALYRVPGAAPATLVPLGRGGALPAPGLAGEPANVTYPAPASWRVVTRAPAPRALVLHLPAVPGWQATLDGRPLPLVRYDGSMLVARVPAGRHVVDLRYWPSTFSVGIALAVAAVVALVVAVVLERTRLRSARPRHGRRAASAA